MWKVTELYLFLRSKAKIVKNKVYDIRNVKYYKNGKIKSCTFRFYFIRMLKNRLFFMNNNLSNLIKMFDVNSNKIHLLQKKNGNDRHIIMESDKGISFSQLHDAIESNDNDDSKRTINDKILINCLLKKNCGDKKCIKHITAKYKEDDPQNSHTLENILLFNDIEYDSETELHIELFDNGVPKHVSFKVHEVKHLHINSLI